MTQILLQAMNNSVAASVALAFVDEFIDGALEGMLIGVLVGAIVMPMVQAPDSMLRSVFFSIMAGLGMSLFQLARIGRATGERLGTILAAFIGPYSDSLGSLILDGVIWVLYSMLAGALVGMLSQVPDKVIKGALVGLFLGIASGGILRVVLGEFNINLSQIVFRILLAALTWALFTVVVGGEE